MERCYVLRRHFRFYHRSRLTFVVKPIHLEKKTKKEGKGASTAQKRHNRF